MITIHDATAELHDLIRELEGLQGRLHGLRDNLPPAAIEAGPDDVNADPDVATEMGRVIDCVLQDSIGPAIRDLLAATEYRPGGEAEP